MNDLEEFLSDIDQQHSTNISITTENLITTTAQILNDVNEIIHDII